MNALSSFEQLNDSACKTYLIVSGDQAMLVDPVLEEVDRYLETVGTRKLTLRYVADTHVHADHLSGAASVRDRTGVDYVMHHNSVSSCANVRIDEGDVLQLGTLEIRVLHVPGHTQDSVAFVLPDRILTGDFLFIGAGGAGRTDLPGGDSGEHWDSLQKLEGLPDEMLIFPAHDYHDQESSTLGREREQNPRLQPRPRDAYVQWLDELRLGPADWMADVVKANYACAMDPRAAWIPVDQPTCEVRGTSGSANAELVQLVGPEVLQEELAGETPPVVIDVREPDEFEGALGHIEGARLIPVGELARRLDELSGLEARAIVTVCKSGGRSSTAAAVLTTSGFTNVRSLDGGMRRWRELG